METKVTNNRWPKYLKNYENADFTIQEKVRFFFNLNLAMIPCIILILIYTVYLQIVGLDYDKIYLPVLAPSIISLLFTFISIWMLIKGHYKFASHFLVTTSLLFIWLVIFFDNSPVVSRLDTIVLITAVLTMLPLIVNRSILTIVIYIAVNILLLLAFLIIFHDELKVPTANLGDFFADSFISIVFIGIVGSGIFRINKRSFERAVSDIKMRLESEKALVESERKYKETADLLPQTVFEADITGRLTYVNKTGFIEFEYSPEELKNGLFMLDMIIESDRPVAKNNLDLLLKGRKGGGKIYTARRKNGDTFPIQTYAGIITLNEQAVGFRGIIINITERRNAEKEIENHKNHLETLVKDRTAELARTNEELKQSNIKLLKQHRELTKAMSHLRKTQEQLVQSEKMASLGVLAAGVAHEINNPLNFIKGGVLGLENYFEEKLESHLPEVSPLLSGIEEGVRRASNIVSSLTHYIRFDEHTRTTCNLHSIIDNCLIMLNSETKYRIEIVKKYADPFPEFSGNEGKLHQAMLNVLVNAIQSIASKGSIVITTSVAKDIVKVIVADDGCGIEEEKISRIFDPFFTTKETGKGTGLGLTITYNIIREHNGTIECISTEGKGTEIIITLPC